MSILNVTSRLAGSEGQDAAVDSGMSAVFLVGTA
jgi:hypothetical protein